MLCCTPITDSTTKMFFVGLLMLALGAAARKTWSPCGLVQLPTGYSMAQPAAGGELSVGLLDNVLMCSCAEDAAGLGQRVELDLSVTDRAGQTAGHVHTAIFPCAEAVCSSREHSNANPNPIALLNSSIEVSPKECSSFIQVLKASKTGLFAVAARGTEDSCNSRLQILLSQTHFLDTAPQTTATARAKVTFKHIIPFNTENCVQQRESNIVFQAVQNTDRRHAISKRANTQPTFLNHYYEVEVAENVPLGTTVTVVQASDPDSGPNGQLNYSMEPVNVMANSGDLFEIDSESGAITTTGTCIYIKILLSYIPNPHIRTPQREWTIGLVYINVISEACLNLLLCVYIHVYTVCCAVMTHITMCAGYMYTLL